VFVLDIGMGDVSIRGRGGGVSSVFDFIEANRHVEVLNLNHIISQYSGLFFFCFTRKQKIIENDLSSVGSGVWSFNLVIRTSNMSHSELRT